MLEEKKKSEEKLNKYFLKSAFKRRTASGQIIICFTF